MNDEYYMVDLPFILEEKRKQDAQQTLMRITINALPHMASNEEGKQRADDIIESLRLQAGAVEEIIDEPDIDGLMKLKSMLSRN